MKHIKPICIIMLLTFLGELLNRLLPLPIPAAIYGLVLFFLALMLGLVKAEAVRGVSTFLTSLLSLLFVPPLVNLMDCWGILVKNLLPILVITVLSLVFTFGSSGTLVQCILKRKGDSSHE